MNPNRRDKIRQRAQKQQRREQRQQQNFTKPLTGPRARHISKAEAKMAYGETLRQNAGLTRASEQQEQRVGDWYNNFANEIAASRGEVAGAYDTANKAIAGNMATAAADDTARRAQLSAQDAQFAQLTGGLTDASAASRGVEAQNQRQLYGSALAAPVTAQGANAFAYLTGQRNNASGEGIYQKVQERKRRQSLQQDRKALLKEKGQYRTTKLDELRKGERDYLIQRGTLGLDKRGAAADAAQAAADRRLKERLQSETERHNRATEQNSREDNADGGLTPAEKREKREDRRDAGAAARTLFETKKWPSWAALTRALEKEGDVSPADARDAVKHLRLRVEREEREKRAAIPHRGLHP